jgi:DNA repair protein RadC
MRTEVLDGISSQIGSALTKPGVIGQCLALKVGKSGRSNGGIGQTARLAKLSRPNSVPSIRNRFSGQDQQEPSPEDVLALIVGYACPAPEVASVATRLLAKFGSVGAVLTAPASHLAAALTDHPTCVALLKGVHKAMSLALREPVETRPVFGKWSALEDYLRVTLGHECDEVVRLLFLDTRNALISDEEHARGTVNHTPLYPRKVIARVLEVGATALIIVHNHPSGDPSPSQEDVAMTFQLVRVLDAIGVKLHDHVVVGRHRCESLRRLGLMP